jgi:hypothetical protein
MATNGVTSCFQDGAFERAAARALREYGSGEAAMLAADELCKIITAVVSCYPRGTALLCLLAVAATIAEEENGGRNANGSAETPS